ncbi:hypothetical protein HK101_004980 [Irineochytrium annulatum]|nr:hypothetical protein HK101_004980 [Irineochytrium annulatum]
MDNKDAAYGQAAPQYASQPYGAPQGQPPVQYAPQPVQPGMPMAGQPQVMYVQGGACQHNFVPTGSWSMKDLALCLFCFPWNFCCCPPGQDITQCTNCGMKLGQ